MIYFLRRRESSFLAAAFCAEGRFLCYSSACNILKVRDNDVDNFFLPWDPLQLSDAVNSGRRVRKDHVAIPLCTTNTGAVRWTPYDRDNMGFAVSDMDEVCSVVSEIFLRGIFHQDSLNVMFYDFGGVVSSFEWPKQPWFHYVPCEFSRERFLRQLGHHVDVIKSKTDGVEPPNKSCDFIVFPVVSPLSTLDIKMMTWLLHRPRQRIYLCPFFICTEGMEELVKRFSVFLFLGRENMDWAAYDVFPSAVIKDFKWDRKLIGLLFDDHISYLQHAYRYGINELSDLGVQRVQQIEDHKTMYEQFLESLG